MFNYFRQLFNAIIGRNPLQEELERVKADYQKHSAKVRESEFNCIRACAQAAGERNTALQSQINKLQAEAKDLQTLTENLRERLASKTKDMEDERKQNAQRLSDLKVRNERLLKKRDEKIRGLREDLDTTLEKLREAMNTLGAECVAEAQLVKLSNAINDLCSAMQSGDESKMEQAEDYLATRNQRLSDIARLHLTTLQQLHSSQE